MPMNEHTKHETIRSRCYRYEFNYQSRIIRRSSGCHKNLFLFSFASNMHRSPFTNNRAFFGGADCWRRNPLIFIGTVGPTIKPNQMIDWLQRAPIFITFVHCPQFTHTIIQSISIISLLSIRWPLTIVSFGFYAFLYLPFDWRDISFINRSKLRRTHKAHKAKFETWNEIRASGNEKEKSSHTHSHAHKSHKIRRWPRTLANFPLFNFFVIYFFFGHRTTPKRTEKKGSASKENLS